MSLIDREPLGQKVPRPKPDRAYLTRVKALPCVICHRPPPSDAHHVICGRYGQRKAGDRETIPLCKECHQVGPNAIHNGKASWIERNGADYEYLPVVADMLNGEWNP